MERQGRGEMIVQSQTRGLHTSKYDYYGLIPPGSARSHLQGLNWNKADSEFICGFASCKFNC